MIKKLILLFSIIMFISCGNENDDIYKTKSKEYASKSGNFIIKFPTKPNYSLIENQIGLDKFHINLIRSTLGINKIFSLEYTDYPEYLLKSKTDEQLFDQVIENYSNKMTESFKLKQQKPIEQHGIKGRYFVFTLKESAIDQGVFGHIEGKIFRKGLRIYTVTYLGVNDKHTDEFINSFRFLK